MSKNKMLETKFDRNAVKTRMIDTAARDHGYDHFELESFDPLVDLMLSALSKELERSHQHFNESYNAILDKLSDRLVPNAMLDYRPACGVVKLLPSKNAILTKDNFKASFIKNENKKELEMKFVPLEDFPCIPSEVKMIANGNHLVHYEGLEKTELKRYTATDSSIYIGLSREKLEDTDCDVNLFFNWFNNPNVGLYCDILSKSNWYHNGKPMDVESGFKSSSNTDVSIEENQDDLWNASLTQKTVDQLKDSVAYHFFNFRILSDWINDDQNNVPKFIKEIIKADANLSFANQLIWVQIELPLLPEVKSLAENIYCQTNCAPVINLNENSSTHKIKEPFKVVRLANDDHFIDIKSIETFDGKKYIERNRFRKKADKVIGTYTVNKQGVLRINEKKAVDNIRELIDQIKEERNAYAAFKPDWIVDELNDVKSNFLRIEHKLGKALEFDPNDVFIIFDDEVKESLLKVISYTSNGDKANNISSGSVLHVKSDLDFDVSDCFLVRSTKDGKSFYSAEEKKLELQSLLQTRNKLVTKEDIKIAIKKLLFPFKINSIIIKRTVQSVPGSKIGLQPILDISVSLNQPIDQDLSIELTGIQTRVNRFLEQNLVIEMPFKVNIKSIV